MEFRVLKFACVFAMAAGAACTARADAFSFDDIDFWVGSGTNRAALVIDWVEGSTEPPALAWGYRWDGEKRGKDMLLAIIAADPRLYAKLGGTPSNPNAVYGLGYDADDDGQFGIDDGTTFDSAGIAFSSADDGAVAIDSGDYYVEGWFMGFWHYGIASTNPYDGGSWGDIQFGMAGRVLTDGAWDSWAFEDTTVPPFDAYATNPTAASPPGGLPGDFNNDSHVDGGDYALWQSKFGSSSLPGVDANGNGIVDAADYVVWRKYAESPAGAFGAIANVPEPATFWLAIFFCISLFFAFNFTTKGSLLMIRNLFHPTCAATIVFWLGASISALAQYGAEVVSYDAGTTPADGYTNASAALGEPERYTGEGVFPGIVSPFSPPYLASEIVSVGEGGHLTLKLSHFAMPQAGPEIGVFENAGLQIDFGNLTVLDPLSTFGDDRALVEVSANGTYWKSLNPAAILFNRPSNGYRDLSDPFSATAGSALSDFQQPFEADLSEFAGLPYSDPSGPDVLEVLAGSGGGTWLDISGTGLPRVGYIRFSVADDFTGAGQNFELDAVSIAHGAVGRPVPEPGTIASALVALFSMLITIRRRSCFLRQA